MITVTGTSNSKLVASACMSVCVRACAFWGDGQGTGDRATGDAVRGSKMFLGCRKGTSPQSLLCH